MSPAPIIRRPDGGSGALDAAGESMAKFAAVKVGSESMPGDP
jgi:hypothetical protein